MTNDSGTLYTGFTGRLQHRVSQHKQKAVDGFTKKYNIHRLVYYEWTDSARGAIEREKQIKNWRRAKKIALVKTMNPTWRGLSKDFDGEAQDSSLRSIVPQFVDSQGAASECASATRPARNDRRKG